MGKELDWVREEESGRLIFRKRCPKDVQLHFGKLELKTAAFDPMPPLEWPSWRSYLSMSNALA